MLNWYNIIIHALRTNQSCSDPLFGTRISFKRIYSVPRATIFIDVCVCGGGRREGGQWIERMDNRPEYFSPGTCVVIDLTTGKITTIKHIYLLLVSANTSLDDKFLHECYLKMPTRARLKLVHDHCSVECIHMKSLNDWCILTSPIPWFLLFVKFFLICHNNDK